MKQYLLPACLLVASPALADSDYVRPITDPATREECSACHMAYPAGFLPARSWRELMGDLENHFGENAQLDEGLRRNIEAYLVANAARRVRGVDRAMTPLRISELPWFRHEHGDEVSERMRERAGSMANCVACHRDAERGYFEDD